MYYVGFTVLNFHWLIQYYHGNKKGFSAQAKEFICPSLGDQHQPIESPQDTCSIDVGKAVRSPCSNFSSISSSPKLLSVIAIDLISSVFILSLRPEFFLVLNILPASKRMLCPFYKDSLLALWYYFLDKIFGKSPELYFQRVVFGPNVDQILFPSAQLNCLYV